jgi:hypothetical protein
MRFHWIAVFGHKRYKKDDRKEHLKHLKNAEKLFEKPLEQWKGSNRKQSAIWQPLSWLKASAFCIKSNKLWWFKTQQLILGTGTAICCVTEPHSYKNIKLQLQKCLKMAKNVLKHLKKCPKPI